MLGSNWNRWNHTQSWLLTPSTNKWDVKKFEITFFSGIQPKKNMTCLNGAWLLSVCINCVSRYIDIWNGWLVYLVKNRHAVIEIGIWSSKIRIKFKCNKHVEGLNRVFGVTQDYGNICRSILEHEINERRVKRNQSGVSAVFPHAERRNQMENSILRVHLATKCCEPYFECCLHSLIIQTN